MSKVKEAVFTLKNVNVFRGDCARMWFDIETFKEPVGPKYPDGWPTTVPGKLLKARMKPFLIGVAFVEYGDLVFKIGASLDESALLRWFAKCAEGGIEVAYCSHNNFDRIVLEGRWTTARRKRLVKPGPWPNILNMFGKKFCYDWVNIWKNMKSPKGIATDCMERGEEIGGVDILKYGPKFESVSLGLIAEHCVRDVAGAMLEDADYRFDVGTIARLKLMFRRKIRWDSNKI